jgi:hypothetical protein
MDKPTFIEFQDKGVTNWVNVESIAQFFESERGTAVISMSDGSVMELDITCYELMRILRVSGCRLLTIDDIDNIERRRDEF